MLKTSSEDKLGATHCVALFAASNFPTTKPSNVGKEKRKEGREKKTKTATTTMEAGW